MTVLSAQASRKREFILFFRNFHTFLNIIDLVNMPRKRREHGEIHIGKRGGHYYIHLGRRVYVKR